MFLIDNLGIFIRGSGVGLFSAAADIGSMLVLAKTKLSLKQQLYISSTLSLSIAFIGHKFWTFKNFSLSRNELIKQIVVYLAWEITFIYIIANVVIYITDPINKYVESKTVEDVEHSKILTMVTTIDEDKHVRLGSIENIIIKHLCIFLLFTFISIPLYSRLFGDPDKKKN